MQYRRLGDSDLSVSELCLGTMTFGQQNTVPEAHQQLDYAIAQGINFIDTAEMYPVPAQAETQGRTESYVGEWLVKQPRDQIILATKIAGPTARLSWIREGQTRIDRANVQQALDDSLRRLQTDYIDLYQIHWPDRYVPLFGAPDYDPKHERDTEAIADQLAVFAELIQAGKIRYLGLSNETAYGVSEFVHWAEKLNLPKIVSIQNAFSLLNRTFQVNLTEVCRFHNVPLLAYSPLAFGLLTGKYFTSPPQSGRVTLFPGFGQRYEKPNANAAAEAYVALAQQHQLSPVQMALAFVRSRWFVGSTIIGATSLEQLQENIASLEVPLDEELLKAIDEIHLRYPNPTP